MSQPEIDQMLSVPDPTETRRQLRAVRLPADKVERV
jgi:hypothetical protein